MLQVPYENCLAVDDAAAGILAAKAAGMITAAFGSACGQGLSDYDLNHFSQVLQFC
jgi:beta-phosphoglucomutase-like phosphatase (HAD superfamily)